jgi:hypothetical protein
MFDRLKSSVRYALAGPRVWREQKERRLLLRLCLGDEAAARRLIALERSRHPGISEGAACRRAIRSYRRDNR